MRNFGWERIQYLERWWHVAVGESDRISALGPFAICTGQRSV